MERSVQLIVAGGISLTAGLWLVAAGDRIGVVESMWLYGGIALAALGVAALVGGITHDLTDGPFGA
ncbi:hypothetical protein [Salinarchaeum laminariae]|uniref:hypothetical protein n=1 Tax=Salinarchaeum laminariae TaxID=869888 RepID=UPI0020C08CAB|nr:hypothetical protein [Salinarchaeum laminariae]